jgi:deoxyribose-phosphate aldolase
MPPVYPDLASFIDHTLLKPDAVPQQIKKLCQEAKDFGFASVCVNPAYVPLCAEELKNSAVKVCTVIGFPLGATLPEVKAFEARRAIARGASEIDMVLNIGALKGGDLVLVRQDIQDVVQACHPEGVLVKVILETSLLTAEEKTSACRAAVEAGADFVKTSTGFSSGGATVEDVSLLRRLVGPQVGVKASGGIRTYADALEDGQGWGKPDRSQRRCKHRSGAAPGQTHPGQPRGTRLLKPGLQIS